MTLLNSLAPARRRRAVRPILALLVVGFVAVGCARDSEAADDGRLRVVATTGMIADAARQIGGDSISVHGLMGPGVDPHLYKATAGDVRAIAGAELILYNGLHLEAAMGEVLAEMGNRTRTVAVGEGVPREYRLESSLFGGEYDPHVWFDVRRWKWAVAAVGLALIEADSANAAYYRANADAYMLRLDSLDAWIRERTAVLPPGQRVLVTAHDAFAYFGNSYGFVVEGLQGISTASEAGTADVQRLTDLIVRRRIPAVFVETSISPRTIEAVQAAARARGVEVRIGRPLYSDALGTAGTAEGTYIGMVRHNVNAIVDALAPAAVAGAPAAPAAPAATASGTAAR